MARSQRRRIVERFVEALRQIQGAYALVCLTNDMLIGARDPIGIRPLVLGRLGSALRAGVGDLRARHRRRRVRARDRERRDRHHHRRRRREPPPFPRRPARPCIFEYIYFARPDSIVGGRNVYDMRKQMGVQLAREAPANADVIIPIPDSGVPAAIGYAQESGMPFELGIIRNHYVGRTFIEPEQRIRQLGVKLKHSANASAVRGKPHRADRRQRGARHHLEEDRADDVRGRRPRGAPARLQPADHASRTSTASTRRAPTELLAANM